MSNSNKKSWKDSSPHAHATWVELKPSKKRHVTKRPTGDNSQTAVYFFSKALLFFFIFHGLNVKTTKLHAYQSQGTNWKIGGATSEWYKAYLTLIGMRQGGYTPLIVFGLDFVSWIFIKNFQTFLEVKIEINQDNLTPCQAHWVL